MRRLLTFLLAVMMCFSMIACSAESGDTNLVSSTTTAMETTLAETTVAQPKDKVLTWDELMSAVTIVELTMDNWEEYFEILEIEEVTPGDFEDEEPDIKRDLYVKLKAENLYAADTTMRFAYSQAMTHNQFDAMTKEQISSSSDASYRDSEDTLTTKSLSYQNYLGTIGSLGTSTYNRYQHNDVIYESILDVKDIECVKVQGTILIVDLPADVWNDRIYGEGKFYMVYEKDGKKTTVMKDFMAQTLRTLFVVEN